VQDQDVTYSNDHGIQVVLICDADLAATLDAIAPNAFPAGDPGSPHNWLAAVAAFADAIDRGTSPGMGRRISARLLRLRRDLKMCVRVAHFGHSKYDMFSTMPRISTRTWREHHDRLPGILQATSCGVVTTTAPIRGTVCVSDN